MKNLSWMMRVLISSLIGLAILASIYDKAASAEETSLALKVLSVGITRPSGAEPYLQVMLDRSSAIAFAKFSSANIGNKIDISLNGEAICSPVLRTAITGGILPVALEAKANRIIEIAAEMASPDSELKVAVSR